MISRDVPVGFCTAGSRLHTYPEIYKHILIRLRNYIRYFTNERDLVCYVRGISSWSWTTLVSGRGTILTFVCRQPTKIIPLLIPWSGFKTSPNSIWSFASGVSRKSSCLDFCLVGWIGRSGYVSNLIHVAMPDEQTANGHFLYRVISLQKFFTLLVWTCMSILLFFLFPLLLSTDLICSY